MDSEKKHPTEPVEESEVRPISVISKPEDDDLEPTNQTEKGPRYAETDVERQGPSLHPVQSHVSTHDPVHQERDQHYEQGDEIYDRFSKSHKMMIVCIMSFCSLLAPISSTSILAASPEVVETFSK